MTALRPAVPSFCDGMSRRTMLHAGALAMGGLSLPQLLQAEAATGRRSQKSVIMVFLSGGPPHQDMVDLKVDAPVEIRGEFRPIATNVPGIEICELLPQLAQRMDRLAVEADRPLPRRREADDRADQGRLAAAVAPEERDGLRQVVLAFRNDSLALPPGQSFVDDLDTATGGWEQ